MSFNFQARYALLTYAQCGDLDPFAVVDRLTELGAECIVAREMHADGGTHLHSFVDFGRKFRTKRSNTFDVGGYHPNISPSHGTPEKGFDYTIKDGDIVAGGLERPCRTSVPTSRDVWAEIILAESRDDFFQRVTTLAPRSMCTSFTQLWKYADWKYRVDPEPYQHDETLTFNFDRAPELCEWSHDTFNESRGVGTFLLVAIVLLLSCLSPNGVRRSAPNGGAPQGLYPLPSP